MGTYTPKQEQVARLGGNLLIIGKAPLGSDPNRAPGGGHVLPRTPWDGKSPRVDLLSGNCPRLFQTNVGEKVGEHAKE